MCPRVAVFDLGSSSFSLLVAEVDGEGALEPLARHRAGVHLGESLGGGSAPWAAVRLGALRAARALARAALGWAPDAVAALATAALRDAPEAPALVTALTGVLGVPVVVLSGAAEATLCALGHHQAIWHDQRGMVSLDLGGGSLELAVGRHGRVLATATAPLGSARMAGELAWRDPLGPAARRRLERRAAAAVVGWPELADRHGVPRDRLVVSGGTAKALARVATGRVRRQGSVHQVALELGQLAELARRLAELPVAERARLPGMPARRVGTVALGAAVLTGVARVLQARDLVVSEWGLREGAAQALGTGRLAPLLARAGSRTGG